MNVFILFKYIHTAKSKPKNNNNNIVQLTALQSEPKLSSKIHIILTETKKHAQATNNQNLPTNPSGQTWIGVEVWAIDAWVDEDEEDEVPACVGVDVDVDVDEVLDLVGVDVDVLVRVRVEEDVDVLVRVRVEEDVDVLVRVRVEVDVDVFFFVAVDEEVDVLVLVIFDVDFDVDDDLMATFTIWLVICSVCMWLAQRRKIQAKHSIRYVSILCNSFSIGIILLAMRVFIYFNFF